MIENIYNNQNENIKNLIDYVENPKSYSFNDSTQLVHRIFIGELTSDIYMDKTTNKFDYENYPYSLELLILLNIKDVLLTNDLFKYYQDLLNFLRANPSKILISPICQYWLQNRKDINRNICKALKELNMSINELYANLVNYIQDSDFIGETETIAMNFIFSQISNDNFNFEIYKKIKKPIYTKSKTKGTKLLIDNISDENTDEIFEKYLISQLESNEKFTKYFVQKYDYWISFYCENIKAVSTEDSYVKSTKLSYILKLFSDICNTAKFNIDKTQTSKILSSF